MLAYGLRDGLGTKGAYRNKRVRISPDCRRIEILQDDRSTVPTPKIVATVSSTYFCLYGELNDLMLFPRRPLS
jgi:hypothetical protein